ncbi:60S ribosomal protein eL21 [Cenococcum geophilum 1.58]|uniref:60S ribosomal protein eL21 n=1 Tax=Cenococcum geophilum 1.58 TaxID=794803 RepID=UPI00358EDAA5|nr:60S ribosomal protein L21-A [Cenococcum geophilum 1.58]
MGHSAGLRAGTRYAFSRGFKKRGYIPLSTYLRQYKVGDIVDVVANGAVQKGMPYKVYHGKTGVIYNVTKSAVGVILYKQVGNRYIEKRVNVRIEHIRLSRSREDFLSRVKENAGKMKKAKTEGVHMHLKRQPAMPREARTVTTKDNYPESITPIPYETTI